MKNLFEISGEERSRILNLHETATKKQYLSEQSTVRRMRMEREGVRDVILTVSTGSSGSIQATVTCEGYPIPMVKRTEIEQNPQLLLQNIDWFFAMNNQNPDEIATLTTKLYIPTFDNTRYDSTTRGMVDDIVPIWIVVMYYPPQEKKGIFNKKTTAGKIEYLGTDKQLR